MVTRKASAGKTLAGLAVGDCGRVVTIAADHAMRQQLYSMGLVEGALVRVVRQVPLGGPVLVAVGSSQYALGREVASCIRVAPR